MSGSKVEFSGGRTPGGFTVCVFRLRVLDRESVLAWNGLRLPHVVSRARLSEAIVGAICFRSACTVSCFASRGVGILLTIELKYDGTFVFNTVVM